MLNINDHKSWVRLSAINYLNLIIDKVNSIITVFDSTVKICIHVYYCTSTVQARSEVLETGEQEGLSCELGRTRF